MKLFDESFKKMPRNYVYQSLLATLTMTLILYFVRLMTHAVVVGALGSSTFVVFAMPHSTTAEPRRLIGGHIVGLLCGIACYYLFSTGFLGVMCQNIELVYLFGGALTVGLAIFLMTITNTEHPPAAGIALGVFINQWSPGIIAFILLFAVGISIVRKLLLKRLKNLY
ncbi:MAG: HPP family protein [Chloroflexota bacterium]